MARQKATQQQQKEGEKEQTAKKRESARDAHAKDSPKPNKKKRTKAQLDRIKSEGSRLAGVAGLIITLSSIRWMVPSQTVQGLQYIVSLSSLGLVCQCPANAGGKMICKHSHGVYMLLSKEWWLGRKRKKIRI